VHDKSFFEDARSLFDSLFLRSYRQMCVFCMSFPEVYRSLFEDHGSLFNSLFSRSPRQTCRVGLFARCL